MRSARAQTRAGLRCCALPKGAIDVLSRLNRELDLSERTGQAIVRAIMKGERNPSTLAALSDPRIRAARADVARSLEGTWQADLLFVLQQEGDLDDASQLFVHVGSMAAGNGLAAAQADGPSPFGDRARAECRLMRCSVLPGSPSSSWRWSPSDGGVPCSLWLCHSFTSPPRTPSQSGSHATCSDVERPAPEPASNRTTPSKR
jgi:hypothetical protein